ncbi:NAD(P)-binding protein, partial [Saccharomonospora halophila]|uniref:NAD(P)-binding protein n=1 Tax=Saccharomonospora halophila TaxID=129922 RepID=UPI00037C65CE
MTPDGGDSVVVVGGGLAGAACAACLTARGIPVTVLERTGHTPVEGVEVLAPGVHPVLSELGLTGHTRDAGFARCDVSVLDWGNGEPPWRSVFAEDGGFDHGYHVGHHTLVESLLARAVSGGARLLRGADVLAPLVAGDGRVT